MNGGRVVVTGASGLIGRALTERASGTAVVVPLARTRPPGSGLWWEPGAGIVHDDGGAISALVHLAGVSVAGGRWTEKRRDEIEQSRVLGTRALVRWLAERRQKPGVLVCASAVGFYGETGEQMRKESDPAGTGFLADVVQKWETEAVAAEAFGLRVVRLRFGVVLSRQGGALRAMEPVFRLGLGGALGSGRQWFPWVHLRDAVGAILWALQSDQRKGAYNVVAPDLVRQGEFAQQLGGALHRPALIGAPAFVLRAALGKMADEALLASQRVVPARLLSEGYRFEFPELEPALAELYGGN